MFSLAETPRNLIQMHPTYFQLIDFAFMSLSELSPVAKLKSPPADELLFSNTITIKLSS